MFALTKDITQIELVSVAFLLALAAPLVLVATVYRHRGLHRFPAPSALAHISPFWFLLQARLARKSAAVEHAHSRAKSKFVRLTHRHVSIADPAAAAVIYGHNSGFLKSTFYDAFEAVHPALFPTRVKSVHARKRKMLNPAFAQQRLLEFEDHMAGDIAALVKAFDGMIAGQARGAALDFAVWSNFMAFDAIADFTFGQSFGFVESGRDDLGLIHILDTRGEYNAALGVAPWLKRWIKHSPLMIDPFWRQGLSSLAKLEIYGRARLSERLATTQDRKDLLFYLLNAVDTDTGRAIEHQELVAEAISFIVGGSDTTSTTMSITIDLLTRHPAVMVHLRDELELAFPDEAEVASPSWVADWATVGKLPYLDAVINEAMRVQPTSAVGLEREVPEGGRMVSGEFFEAGTILSVPTRLVHRGPVFGKDADVFRPERWIEGSAEHRAAMISSFLPFSIGPRSCIGRNFAWMEMKKVLGTLLRKFHFDCIHPNTPPTPTREGFFVKPTSVPVTIRK